MLLVDGTTLGDKSSRRQLSFSCSFKTTRAGEEEKNTCIPAEAEPTAIHCYGKPGRHRVLLCWKVQMSFKFTEGLIIATLESFQDSKSLITDVGCVLPTTVLEDMFGKQFLWPDAFLFRATTCFYTRMRCFTFHKSLTHYMRYIERQRMCVNKKDTALGFYCSRKISWLKAACRSPFVKWIFP